VLGKPLDEGLRALGLELPDRARGRLLDYLQLLQKWNRVYNLTAVHDPRQMVSRHLLDSLAIVPYVQGPRVLDMGTGAGLPGIPLALALPGHQFVLLDSNSKKTRFVRQAVASLGIENIEVIHARLEQYRPAEKFDTLVTRAFASIKEALEAARHLFAQHSEFLAMKGAFPEQELHEIPGEFEVRAVHPLAIPGLDAQRHLVVVGLKVRRVD
jgi:16S rRNA (guanine527-N7)-methyltransferase